MYDIIIGRSRADKEKYGTKGTIFLGRHYVKMGQTVSLSNKIFMDVSRSHAVFICGKRGGGKSYTMGVLAEGILDLPPEIKQNLSVVILDTMGIYWSMKYPNRADEALLNEWKLSAKGLDVKIYTPTGFYHKFKKQGVPTDFPFSIQPKELDSSDWCITFGVEQTSPIGVLIERTIHILKGAKENYSIKDIIRQIEKDDRANKDTKNAAENMFLNALGWGLFDVKGVPIEELAMPGNVVVLDVSCYSAMPNNWKIKSLVVGLVSQKLFIKRMTERKLEEYKDIHHALHYFYSDDEDKKKAPMVWLIIDEAHEFLPNKGTTLASMPLITILREGRQPGISLVLASQQPGKIHTDVMTQSDIVLSHRITAKIDTDALGVLMQSYMRQSLNLELDNLPRMKGAALIFDDTNEKMYPMQVRPRFTWHGGSAPNAIPKEEKEFKI